MPWRKARHDMMLSVRHAGTEAATGWRGAVHGTCRCASDSYDSSPLPSCGLGGLRPDEEPQIDRPRCRSPPSGLRSQSAEGQSRDMVANNFFSHTGSNGSTLLGRVAATGYTWSSLRENIAGGYPTIDAVMTGWRASDGPLREPDEPDLRRGRFGLRAGHCGGHVQRVLDDGSGAFTLRSTPRSHRRRGRPRRHTAPPIGPA